MLKVDLPYKVPVKTDSLQAFVMDAFEMAFANVDDAKYWMTSNGIMDSTLANSVFNKARYAISTKTRTFSYHFDAAPNINYWTGKYYDLNLFWRNSQLILGAINIKNEPNRVVVKVSRSIAKIRVLSAEIIFCFNGAPTYMWKGLDNNDLNNVYYTLYNNANNHFQQSQAYAYN